MNARRSADRQPQLCVRVLAVLFGCLLLAACGTRQPSVAASGSLSALAASAEGFEQAAPGVMLQFPLDHGAHPAYRIEWWYLTANLEDADGRPYGAQWTLFRSAQRSPQAPPVSANPWQSPQVYMAHFAVTSDTEHRAFQRYARGGSHGGLARAGASAVPFRAWLDDWYLASLDDPGSGLRGARRDSPDPSAGDSWLPLDVSAGQDGYALRLRLSSEHAPLLQGDHGFSRKHPNGGGSYYYSQPFLSAEGELQIDGRTVNVTGQAWLDREWSSQFLQADQSGWDWLALHLDSREKLMLFRLREVDSEVANFRHGVLISADGRSRELDPARIRFQPLERARIAGRDIPVRWRIDLEELGRSLDVAALHPGQWMDVDFAYWEGYVTASGVSPGETGRGYLEMVGYPPR